MLRAVSAGELKRHALLVAGACFVVLVVVPVIRATAAVALTQEGATSVPTLTETQRLQFQVLSQQMEIAQLKFEAAKTEMTRLAQALQVPGYVLDLATLSYRTEQPKTKEATP